MKKKQFNSGSESQINQGWNLDIGELAYSPSARDLSDAKIHHMLSEESWKPYRRVYQLSLCYAVWFLGGFSDAFSDRSVPRLKSACEK